MKALNLIVVLVGALVAGLIPLYAFAYLLYLAIGLPMRRQERARLFLDLAETGLAQGRSVEQTIVSVSHSEDRSIGVRFHLVSAYIESGWSLIPALQKVSGFLPPALTAMLKVGEEIGDPGRVLPACRTLLRDGTAQVQSAYNYLVVLAFVLIPLIPALFWIMSIFIIPKYEQIFADLLEGQALPIVPFHIAAVLSQVQIVIALLFYLGAAIYIGGPRMLAWLGAGLFLPKLDGLIYRVPWKKKRMQRDFAGLLGVLLDAGVPEERAVLLAGEATVNRVFIRRAEGVAAQLRKGVKLTEAISQLDDTGEFHWRLANALHSGKNFFAALAGWLESLDARAFRQQQTFAQLITTALVLYNGMMVSLFAVFVFRGLTMVIEEGVLW